MIARRNFILALGAALLASQARAQSGGMHRLGILFPGTAAIGEAYFRAFFESLAGEGYVEGRNLVVERRFAEFRADRLDSLARELVAANVGVIYAPPTPAALAAKKASSRVSIVFSMASDPVANGLVKTLAHPEGNATGLSTLGRELAPKRIELLRELVPNIHRVGLLYDTYREPSVQFSKESAIRGAKSLGVIVIEEDVHSRERIADAFGSFTKKGAEALLVFEGALALGNRSLLIEQAAAHRIPALYTYPEYPTDGGLMSYSASFVNQYRRAGLIVARLLKGAKPADIPVEQPTTFELVINLRTAKALGIKVPQSILVRADKVIE